MSAALKLNLNDIQGNIVKGYGRFGFPYGRYILYSIENGDAARKFIEDVMPFITSSVPWKTKDDGTGVNKPLTANNIAFTYHGLKKLGLSEESLHSFPEDFSMGMRGRTAILGDDGVSAPEYWDPVWNSDEDYVSIFIGLNGQTKEAIEQVYEQITRLVDASQGGVVQLVGHRGAGGRNDLPYQEANAVFENGEPTGKEHFGYSDGISNPFFKGTDSNDMYAIGNGKPNGHDPRTPFGWDPIEAGEFILGYRDEAREQPETPAPNLLGKNGTYMVYRKLHQNVGSFERYLQEEATRHESKDAEYIAAKFAGRWRNGAPLALFPTFEDAENFMKEVNDTKMALRKAKGTLEEKLLEVKYLALLSKLVGFDYNDDLDGSRCPLGSHIRRCNPRSALEFGVKGAFNTPGALSDRRRILRRGLPYGDSSDRSSDKGDHGIIFLVVCSSISRQFEFVQQQWINYGNDFKLANEKDVILGNHGVDAQGRGTGRMTFQSEAGSGKSPHFCSHIPRFVETRGGEYFFVPSFTALQMIARGNVDPT